jgi:hypothetical protein
MNRCILRQQREGAGIDPTPPITVADKGIVLEEKFNQFQGHVGKEYSDYNGDTLIQFLFNLVSRQVLRSND